jgi:hypothetical protein
MKKACHSVSDWSAEVTQVTNFKNVLEKLGSAEVNNLFETVRLTLYH